jgi:hypothetical protein
MELIAFIVLLVLGFFTIITENRSILRYIYIPSVFFFMVIVRLNGFDFGGYQKDILTYSLEMKSTSFSLYYLREFIFWIGLRLLYTLTDSELFTFLILDVGWIYFLIKVSKLIPSKQLGKGVIIIMSTSFPFLFGYENIYRQFYATIILLYAYSLINKNNNKVFWLFIVSIFIHNLALFTLPIFLIRKCYKFKLQDRFLISFFLSLIILLTLPFLLNLKGIDSTKIDLSFLYLFLFLGVFCFAVMKFKDNLYKLYNAFPSLLPAAILITGFVFLKQEMISERVGMMFLVLLLCDSYNFSIMIESKLSRVSLRVLLLLLFSLPVFFTDSSLKFLY